MLLRKTIRQWLPLPLCCLLLFFPAACSSGPQLPPLAPDAVILCFGDSLTYGTGASEAESYPMQLAALTGRRVTRAGVPGELSARGLERLPEALDETAPDLLILCHGGNDLLQRQDQGQLKANLAAMIELARSRGVAVMLIAVPEPSLALKPPALYGELAREFDLPIERKILADIVTKGSLKSDRVHPNAAGYRKMAEAVAKALRRSGAL